MKSSEIFALGYAIPQYDIRGGIRVWRYGGDGHSQADVIELPADAVMLHKLPGVKFSVAKWSDVLAAKGIHANSGNR